MSDTDTTPTVNGNGNGKRRRTLLVITAIFVIAAIAWFLYWLLVLSHRESTDDAYLSGDQVSLTTQVGGTVVEVAADDTQRVEAGQSVVKLDASDAQAALDRAAATLAQTVRQARQLRATAAQADASVQSAQAQLARAEEDVKQRRPLLATQAIAAEELRHAETEATVAAATVRAAQRQADAAHQLVDGADVAHQPAVLEARAAYQQAWLAAHRTSVIAPISGQVARRSVQVGQHVQPGQSLMMVVALDHLWVDANFKESQLRKLHLGQDVEVITDLYGSGVIFHGKVEGLAAGTGSAFSLLPAQNASGNWIKVVQRVPVRIALDPQELKKNPLRIGLSAEVRVSTTDQSGPVLATQPSSTPFATTSVYEDDLKGASAAADAIIRTGQSAQ
ncbi:MAG: HlyD family efflux transporter periplasmic adaptor subunit [Steroidobacteraceae bacterium]